MSTPTQCWLWYHGIRWIRLPSVSIMRKVKLGSLASEIVGYSIAEDLEEEPIEEEPLEEPKEEEAEEEEEKEESEKKGSKEASKSEWRRSRVPPTREIDPSVKEMEILNESDVSTQTRFFLAFLA
ncbi:hypothetical protein Tco_0856170 [Tanacetum coccineum]